MIIVVFSLATEAYGPAILMSDFKIIVILLYIGTANSVKYHIPQNDVLIWGEARKICSSKGMELAFIKNAADMKYYMEQYSGQSSCAWVGLIWESSVNRHVWLDGDTLSWVQWATNEPDCLSSYRGCLYDCVVIDPTIGNTRKLLRTASCSEEKCVALCQEKIVPSTVIESAISNPPIRSSEAMSKPFPYTTPMSQIPLISISSSGSLGAAATFLSTISMSQVISILGSFSESVDHANSSVSVIQMPYMTSNSHISYQDTFALTMSQSAMNSMDSIASEYPNLEPSLVSARKEKLLITMEFPASIYKSKTPFLFSESIGQTEQTVTSSAVMFNVDQGHSQYHLSQKEALDWNESRSMCNQEGMDIASVKSSDDLEDVKTYIIKKFGVGLTVWIGMFWNETVKKHYWTDNELVIWSIWENGEPDCLLSPWENDRNNGRCVTMEAQHCVLLTAEFRFRSAACSGHYGVLCQRDLPVNNSVTTHFPTTADGIKTTSEASEVSIRPKRLNCRCPCRKISKKWHWLDGSNVTKFEVIKIVTRDFEENIEGNIKVDKSNLTRTIQRKISVDDERPVSKSIGWAAMLFIAIPIGFIILIDISNMIKYPRDMIRGL